MKRFLVFFLVFAIMISCMPFSYAINTGLFADSPHGIPGIIDFEDKGDYIAMIQVRLRELGYFHFKPTGRFQGMTRDAVIQFQIHQTDAEGKQIISDGTVGQQSVDILFSAKAVRAPIAQSIPIGPKADGSQTKKGESTDWDEMKSILNEGTTYLLTDYNTGVTFQMVFTGGDLHAEMECKSGSDTEAYKKVFGNAFNYSKRPMLISANGKLIACSLQGEPHGSDTVSNNDMAGHACLYFNNSKSHVGGLADVEHIRNVFTAAGSQ